MKERIVKDFLSLHLKKGSKLLLGLSGGPDSMALLYFLLECREALDFSLHVAHIDHGWREESKSEAQALMNLAKQLNLPFHLRTLEGMNGGDLENRCREERLRFFQELHEEYHFQALLLAHHGGDQAETVLKRVFEGAGLSALGGLRSIRTFGTLPIWRPLLPFNKEELLRYLDRKHVPFFNDSTNSDPTYLRSRMREKIFPTLEEQFGKNIQTNCLRLGSLCQEVSSYFDEKVLLIKEKLVEGPFGAYLPLDFHPVELKHFLRGYAPGANLSNVGLDLLIKLIRHRKVGRMVEASPLTFYVSRAHLFILNRPFPNFFNEVKKWNVIEKGGWENFWKGEIAMPDKGVQLESLSKLEPRLRKKMKKWYVSRGVPTFFYDRAPIYMREGKIVGECLTGCDLKGLY